MNKARVNEKASRKQVNDAVHQPVQDQLDLAIVYVLGDGTPAERASFEQLLTANAPGYADALAEAQGLVGDIECALPEAAITGAFQEKARECFAALAPSTVPDVKRKLHSVPPRNLPEGSDEKATALGTGFHLMPHAEDWVSTPMVGVSMRTLFTDPESGMLTYLLKLDPGARVPPHRHPGTEQCWVLEGELKSGKMIARAGDFFVAEKSTVHSVIRSDQGCTLLIFGPADNEYGVRHAH